MLQRQGQQQGLQEQKRRRCLASTRELAHPSWFPEQESPRPERRGLLEQQELGSQAWALELARLSWVQQPEQERGQEQQPPVLSL